MKINWVIKKIVRFILNFFKTSLWLFRLIKNSNFHNYTKKEIRDKPLAIFANGPSLLDVINSDKVDEICNNNDLIFVNNAAISSYYGYGKIKPKYYIFADPGYWLNIESATIERENTFDAIVSKTDWPLTLFFPCHAFKFYSYKERFKGNSFLHILPYHAEEWIGYERLAHSIYRRGLAMPKIQNVVGAAIFTGINLGYKEVKLYGVEHSWTSLMCVNENNQVCLIDRHYYDMEPLLKPWLKIDEKPYTMHEILRDLAFMFESYHKLELYARSEGVTITNYTKNSFIDAFARSGIK